MALGPATPDCCVIVGVYPTGVPTTSVGAIAKGLCCIVAGGGATGALTLPCELISSSSTMLMVACALILQLRLQLARLNTKYGKLQLYHCFAFCVRVSSQKHNPHT